MWAACLHSSWSPTWDGHVPDQDGVEEAGHGQQQVGQELLEAAQPAGLLPRSGGQGPWLTPVRKGSGMSREQAVTRESPAPHEAVGGSAEATISADTPVGVLSEGSRCAPSPSGVRWGPTAKRSGRAVWGTQAGGCAEHALHEGPGCLGSCLGVDDTGPEGLPDGHAGSTPT